LLPRNRSRANANPTIEHDRITPRMFAMTIVIVLIM
jgi:hypothetical protein